MLTRLFMAKTYSNSNAFASVCSMSNSRRQYDGSTFGMYLRAILEYDNYNLKTRLDARHLSDVLYEV